MRSSIDKYLIGPFIGCAVLGTLLFGYSFGFKTLDASWSGWLYSSKRMQYEAAWLAYRNAQWSFPLGHLSQFFYPHGSSVAYMDGAPWYLTFLKIIGPILPDSFSAWGAWILLCCVLQFMTAFLLMRSLSERKATVWLGTILLGISPVFIERSIHLALLAHWIVLLSWVLFFRPQSLAATKYLWLGLIAFVSGIHPYLMAMVMAIRMSAIFLDAETPKVKVKDVILSLLVALSVLGLFGYFSNGATKDEGADFFTADIATFINSTGHSALLPGLNEANGEDEGFGYLGAGGILIAVCALVSLIAPSRGEEQKVPIRQLRIAFLAALALTIFAFGPTVKYLGNPAFSNPLYSVLAALKMKSLPHIFRMPGRFIWPLYYLILAAGCRAVNRKTAVLALLVVLQFLDLGPFLLAKNQRIATGARPPMMHNAAVVDFLNRADNIVFVPLQPRTACGFPESPEANEDLIAVLQISAKLGTPMNSGLQARTPLKIVGPQCEEALSNFKAQNFECGTAYIVDTELVPPEFFGTSPKLFCRRFDRVSVCGTPDSF